MPKFLSSAWGSQGKKDENSEMTWELYVQAVWMRETQFCLKYWGQES